MTSMRSLVCNGAILLFILAMVTAARADAATFVVNSTADTGDAHVGDGVCSTSGNVCTLRAAIQEANASAGLDTITFAIGSGVQTINAASGFSVTNPVVIDRSEERRGGKEWRA